MIRVFHGFLGSPDDFRFLERPGVILHDLYKGVPETSPEDILIGYSMGGRLAMELAFKNGFRKLILINAHPGLRINSEREQRSRWEEEVLAQLSRPETFLTWWNALPIFKADSPLKNIPVGSDDLFKRMALSHQENFLPFLEANAEKVHWIIGRDDEKYSALAGELTEFDVRLVPGGHRLFQHPEVLSPIIQELIA